MARLRAHPDRDGERFCNTCQQYKPRENFYTVNKKRGWLDTNCIRCRGKLWSKYVRKRDRHPSRQHVVHPAERPASAPAANIYLKGEVLFHLCGTPLSVEGMARTVNGEEFKLRCYSCWQSIWLAKESRVKEVTDAHPTRVVVSKRPSLHDMAVGLERE